MGNKMNRILIIKKCNECRLLCISNGRPWCGKVEKDLSFETFSPISIPDWCPLDKEVIK
jgi:hypothetical protein